MPNWTARDPNCTKAGHCDLKNPLPAPFFIRAVIREWSSFLDTKGMAGIVPKDALQLEIDHCRKIVTKRRPGPCGQESPSRLAARLRSLPR